MTNTPLGKVHGGFWAAWMDVQDSMYKYPRTEKIEPKNPARPIWLCGHSLGGAIASLAGTQLHRDGYTIKGVYTFGQPRVFNTATATAYFLDTRNEQFPTMHRYVFTTNPIPSVPPAWMGFSHLGDERYEKQIGSMMQTEPRGWYWPKANDHRMTNYKNLLAALVSINDDPASIEVLKWLDNRSIQIAEELYCDDWRQNWEETIFHWTDGGTTMEAASNYQSGKWRGVMQRVAKLVTAMGT